MIQTFDAIYDPEEAARAERTFYVRSLLELRRASTLGTPITFLAFVVGGLLLDAPIWFVALFALWLALSLLGPLFFYVARPIAARRHALAHPVRQIKLTQEGIEVGGVDLRSAKVEWRRVKHVWETGDYLLLVLGKFVSVGIPKRSLPEGADAFVRASVKECRRGRPR